MEDAIVRYYSAFDEWGRLDREPLELMVNLHYMRKYLPDAGRILDIGAGPGKYAMKLAAQGCRMTVADVTPKLVEIAKDKAAELALSGQFDGFHTADARSLAMFIDNSFDASLMLGPLYHLQDEADRVQAVQELARVTRAGGVVCVAFMPRTRMLAVSLADPLLWKPNHTAEELAAFAATGAFNHADEGRFTGAYYMKVEEIEPFMAAAGFERLELIASEGISSGMKAEAWAYWNSLGEDAAQRVFALICDSAADPALLGASSHLLYIGRKR